MSTNMGKMLLEQDILLESGTNEVEVLVFRVDSFRLGINVAKVREILSSQTITKIPQSHPSVIGCFRLRDTVVPCVSLHQHLSQTVANTEKCNLILAEFNRSQLAFLVDEVERIYRISWEQISPVPTIVSDSQSPVTAVTRLDGSLVSMLDFELIASQISQTDPVGAAIANPNAVARDDIRVLVVDDSPTVRVALETTLQNSGYNNVNGFDNGSLAWNWIQQRLSETGDPRQVADIIISDVEMPSMDGLHLTRNIKNHPQLGTIPVILYSSILTPDNLKKGVSVGADAQVTKPDISKVIETADYLVTQRRDHSPATSSEPVAPVAAPVAATPAAELQPV